MPLVYMITSKTTTKSYVGFTMGSFEKRFNKHIQNALRGVETHFYRAIRKYGIQDFTSTILWQDDSSSRQAAQEKEIEMIKKYDTYYTGYNMTHGGDGGLTWGDRTEDILKQRTIKKVSVEENNGRWCGKTDEEIVQFAVEMIINNNGKWSRTKWHDICRQYNLPLSFSKNRFNGSEKVFKQQVLEALLVKGINITDLKYVKSEEHKQKIIEQNKRTKWFTNVNTGEIIKTANDMDPLLWIRGRKNVNN